ncbi:MAG TPA: LON peptidase substrate-binding domain-containing protein [Steroidobacteraceae bacterium]|nr:LON peptidase substrate-binding domain-containing protein [Steroidobacteraceae bacterium]
MSAASETGSGRTAAEQEIALFPLHAVLLPGGLLPLRIFEPRYVDLVSRCLRSNEAFGVVLIQAGEETESSVSIAPVGTSARIVDFQPLADGLLGLLCRGERRFRVLSRRRQPDGLNCAAIDWLSEAGPEPLEPVFQPLADVVREAFASLTNSQRFIEPHYEDAGWVSHRLAEMLPLEPALLQRLLELDQPGARLRLLAPLIDAQGADGR